MGSLYKRKQKLEDGTVRELPTIWIKYYQNGRAVRESTGTTKETVARRMLRVREGDVERGIPITPKMGRVTFEQAAEDLRNDYTVNRRKTLAHVKRRIDLHLARVTVKDRKIFADRLLANITTADIRSYIAERLKEGAAPANVNRELAVLKRMYSLAVQGSKLATRPHIPMMEEDNVRSGFFEREQLDAVRAALPAPLRPVVTFAYLTGWRVASEILPLTWRHVDWAGREVRLDPGSTKNGDGRVFPFTEEIERLLKTQLEDMERRKRERRSAEGNVVRIDATKDEEPETVFHRAGVAIKDFRGAFASACKAAGCDGRILHDFRRTAVRNLERAGVSRSAAMAMVGHKTEAIYRRYAIVDTSVLRDAAAKLDRAANR